MYAKPLLLAILSFLSSLEFFQPIICRRSKRGSAGFRHCVILIAGPAADPDCADDLPALLQGNAAREDHNTPIVGSVDSEKLVTRLTVSREIFRRYIKCPRRVCLLLGNVYAAYPRAVHAHMGDKIPALVGYRDIHRLADFSSLFFSSRYDSSCIAQCQSDLLDELFQQLHELS
jgi:hypothetical protein